MKRMLSDTKPEAERVHIRIIREAGPVRRAEMLGSLTDEAIEMSLSGLKKRNPMLSPQEVHIKYIELLYGKTVASAMRKRNNAA